MIVLQQLQQNASICSCTYRLRVILKIIIFIFILEQVVARSIRLLEKSIFIYFHSSGRTIQFPLKTRRLSVRFICPLPVAPIPATMITTRTTIIITFSGGGVVGKTKYCSTRRVVSYGDIYTTKLNENLFISLRDGRATYFLFILYSLRNMLPCIRKINQR